MAPFRFRLMSVLRYRKRIKDERRWELHALEGARDRLLSETYELEQALMRQTEEAEEQQGKMLSVVELKLRGDFFQQVAERLREKCTVLASVERKLEEKRNELVQADRDFKSLERLRERRWEEHRRKENKEEQKLLDEVGQRQYLVRGDGKKFP